MAWSGNDPKDTVEIWEARYELACKAFKGKEISLDVFRATLYGLGFRGQEIASEVNLHWPEEKKS